MSSLLVVRSFEIAVFAAFLLTLIWIWRQRNPLYLGALIAGGFCFVFDWTWCARSFFNATFHPDLIDIPGLTTQGLSYPLSLPPAWALAFGLPTILLVKAAPWLDRRFGALGYVLVWVGGSAANMAAENLLVGVLHIYTYHQKPEFLCGVVPWSNLLLTGNLQLLCYAGLRYMQRWAALPARVEFGLRSESTWKGLAMGAMPIWAAFVLAYAVQLFWYGSADPWIESGRPF